VHLKNTKRGEKEKKLKGHEGMSQVWISSSKSPPGNKDRGEITAKGKGHGFSEMKKSSFDKK